MYVYKLCQLVAYVLAVAPIIWVSRSIIIYRKSLLSHFILFRNKLILILILIPYDDLKKHLLKEFSPTTSERARRLLLMPSQHISDRKPSQLWDEICMLSRLPETDEDSKNKEVDLKKEIWLQTLPSCVRVLLHNTDEKSMDDLSTLADEIMMSQNAACHDTSRCLPPDVMYVRRTPDVMPVRRTPDVTPVRRTLDVTPVRRTPDVTPVRRTPDVTPVRRTPDVMPRPAETTDDVVPVQRAN